MGEVASPRSLITIGIRRQLYDLDQSAEVLVGAMQVGSLSLLAKMQSLVEAIEAQA